MIRLKGICKSYNGREVLKGIDLEIADQDYLVILGASGSGKSTLLNVLSGLEKPDSGHVYYKMCIRDRDILNIIKKLHIFLSNMTSMSC